jgi:molecular chaperone IbpA
VTPENPPWPTVPVARQQPCRFVKEDMAMRTFDFSPLFRSTIGFDRVERLLDAAMRIDEAAVSYPPYNIEKMGENAYRISMAVAGFSSDELEVTLKESTLFIVGRPKKPEAEPTFLYRGIAGRAFERRFELDEYIKVKGASLINGLLHVELAREVPEEARPRTIRIETTPAAKTIEAKAA